jgi:hypothetical protein
VLPGAIELHGGMLSGFVTGIASDGASPSYSTFEPTVESFACAATPMGVVVAGRAANGSAVLGTPVRGRSG